MKRAEPLTERQAEAMRFIQSRVKEIGVAPSHAEIGEALGLRSKGAPSRLIDELVARGYLRRSKHKARGLDVVKRVAGKLAPATEAAGIAAKLRRDAVQLRGEERAGMLTAAKHYEAVARMWRDEGKGIE